MPKGTKVHRCKTKVQGQGKSVGAAIAICQKSTGQSYATGKALKKGKKRGG